MHSLVSLLACLLCLETARAGVLTFDEIVEDGVTLVGYLAADGVRIDYRGINGWTHGYGGLIKIGSATAPGFRHPEYPIILLTPPPGKRIELISFDTAARRSAISWGWWAVDGHAGPAFITAPTSGSLTVAMGVRGHLDQRLVMSFGPPVSGLGFDNITYTVTPIPAALPLLATALGGLAWVMGRRRA
jgi:hypothetical protein